MPNVATQPAGLRPSAARGIALGAGRSGYVLKVRVGDRTLARKVFRSGPLTKAVQYLSLGAPNPYAWNDHAVQCAYLRRRILAPLVRLWFGSALRVAEAEGTGWDPEQRAHYLDSQFVRGRHPTLHHPINQRGASEVGELLREVQAPLADHLMQAGFDGMVWQAGFGNPVALGNFLLERPGEPDAAWVWIDLESGVPALFPLDPRKLVRFYVPRSWRLKRPLFDDVDLEKLERYLDARRPSLGELLGAAGLARVFRDLRGLAYHQRAWKRQPWLERGIGAQLASGALTEGQAEHYRAHRWRFWSREAARLPLRLLADTSRAGLTLLRRARGLEWGALSVGAGRFLCSQEWRAHIARRFVRVRIDSWEAREQLLAEEAHDLREQLATREESSAWLSDFGVHVALKPFVKLIEYLLLPILFAWGRIDPATLALALFLGGPLARTLYTAGRTVQALAERRAAPWIALGVGALPVLGNLAYPAQIAVASRGEDDHVAQFILYDGCTAIGRRLPLWGGYDTWTEHAFNHLPDWVVRGRSAR